MKITIEKPREMTLQQFADQHDLEMRVGDRGLTYENPAHRYYAGFTTVWLKDRGMTIGVSGNGRTPDEAIRDYATRISGKEVLLTLDAKETVFVPPLLPYRP